MKTDDLFHSSSRRIAEFAETQVHLYRHDVRLQDYFLQLQMDTLKFSRAALYDWRAPHRNAKWTIRLADKVSRARQPKKIKADILFCPLQYSGRKTENRLLIRTLLGLVQTDAEILCMLPANAACRAELDAQLSASGRGNQVTFLDLTIPFNSMEGRLRRRAAQVRALKAFQDAVRVLEPYGLSPSPEVMDGFEHTADYVEAWERMAPQIEFDAVVSRCHWHTLCSPVCRTGLQRGKPVITFQQGVIGHSLDVPVTASKFIAFGHSSASFLERVNDRFFQAAEMPKLSVEYIRGGSFIDPVTVLPDQFDLKTLLMVDVQVNLDDFYGVATQFQSLIWLAEKLLASDLPLRRLVIRPHPYWTDLELETVQRLVRQHSARCELSHPAWSLEDDLRRSSATVGIFSGVLTVAAANGLPTYFLKTEHGFWTEDLATFSRGQTVFPEDAFREIGKILTDHRSYLEARKIALENAREYYANGTNFDFSASFFERLLKKKAAANQSESEIQ